MAKSEESYAFLRRKLINLYSSSGDKRVTNSCSDEPLTILLSPLIIALRDIHRNNRRGRQLGAKLLHNQQLYFEDQRNWFLSVNIKLLILCRRGRSREAANHL